MLNKFRHILYRSRQNLRSLFIYPSLQWRKADYDAYWKHRKLTLETPLNSFQKMRVLLSLKYIETGASVTDVGSGNGRMLIEINEKKKLSRMVAVDVSEDALSMAEKMGIETKLTDITQVDELNKLSRSDYIMMFEILEHIPNPESLLNWAIQHVDRGVLFSVPNTGFIFHRLRLLFGRFPLQWRLQPSEHVRFWTVGDMKWWLGEMGVKDYHLHLYEGVGLINRVWPALFGQGMLVFIPRSNNL